MEVMCLEPRFEVLLLLLLLRTCKHPCCMPSCLS